MPWQCQETALQEWGRSGRGVPDQAGTGHQLHCAVPDSLSGNETFRAVGSFSRSPKIGVKVLSALISQESQDAKVNRI